MMNVLYFAIGLITALAYGHNPQPAPSFGAALPQTPAGFETSLAAPITSSATSMTLTANSTRGGTALSGYNCFTIDAGSAQAEYVCGTVSGTAVTSITRGIDDVTGTTTNATLQFSHRRGASIQVTDFPAIQIMRAQLNGSDTIPNLMTYADTAFIGVGAPTTTLATKYYVDNVAVAGASNADESTKGIGEIATAAEAAAGTSVGSTLARLFLPSSLATSSPTVSCSTACVVVAAAGEIARDFLDNNHYIFSSFFATNASTTNATTTNLAIRGVSYSWPSSQGSANSVLVNNGSGGLSWTVYTATSSSSTIAELNTYRGVVNQTTYQKVKEFTVNAGGAYFFQWRQRSGNAANTCSAIVSIDGTASTSAQSTNSTASTTMSVSLGGFTAGTGAELWIKTDIANGEYCMIDNFIVQASFVPTGTVVTN